MDADMNGFQLHSDGTIFFFGTDGSKKGFYTISPNGATYDKVSPTGKDGVNEYPLQVEQPDGSPMYSWYYTDPTDSRGEAASEGKDFGNTNPGVNFYKLGSPKNRVSQASAIKAIENEVLPRLKSMIEVKKRADSHASQSRKPSSWSEEKAKQALCACADTKNATISQAVTAISQQLDLKGMDGCTDQFISSGGLLNRYRMSLLLPLASASTPPSKGHFDKVILSTSLVPAIMKIDGKFAEICNGPNVFRFDTQTGKTTSLAKPCAPSAIGRMLVSSTKINGSVKVDRIEFTTAQ